jgi:hypothetical protein
MTQTKSIDLSQAHLNEPALGAIHIYTAKIKTYCKLVVNFE